MSTTGDLPIGRDGCWPTAITKYTVLRAGRKNRTTTNTKEI